MLNIKLRMINYNKFWTFSPISKLLETCLFGVCSALDHAPLNYKCLFKMSNCTRPVHHKANITFLSRQEEVPTTHMINFNKFRIYSWTSNSSIEVEKRETPHTLPTEGCMIQHLECRRVVSTWNSTRSLWNWHDENYYFSQKPVIILCWSRQHRT
jgi:hypothetical protein